MNVFGVPTRKIKIGDDLFSVFEKHFSGNLPEKSILVVTSKIVSLSEKAVQKYFSEKEFFEIVAREADKIVAKKGDFFLTEKSGFLMPNAGIDKSNAPPKTAILLPRNPQKFADDFREKLRQKFHRKNIGIVVADSRVVSRRRGISGVALAWSGFFGVSDERGKTDLFGRKLAVSEIAVADNLASVAQIFFGQSAEKTPFCVFEKCETVFFTDAPQNPKMAKISQKDDLFS